MVVAGPYPLRSLWKTVLPCLVHCWWPRLFFGSFQQNTFLCFWFSMTVSCLYDPVSSHSSVLFMRKPVVSPEYDPLLTCLHLQWACFQTRSWSELQGGRTSTGPLCRREQLNPEQRPSRYILRCGFRGPSRPDSKESKFQSPHSFKKVRYEAKTEGIGGLGGEAGGSGGKLKQLVNQQTGSLAPEGWHTLEHQKLDQAWKQIPSCAHSSENP